MAASCTDSPHLVPRCHLLPSLPVNLLSCWARSRSGASFSFGASKLMLPRPLQCPRGQGATTLGLVEVSDRAQSRGACCPGQHHWRPAGQASGHTREAPPPACAWRVLELEAHPQASPPILPGSPTHETSKNEMGSGAI